jgi:hypothetical protein
MRHYILDGGTEVLDCQTGLIWRREIAANLTYSQALEEAEIVTRETGQAWRVPTLQELWTLVLVGGARTSTASTFPGMPARSFWSSSPYVDDADYVWFVSFNYGDSSISLSNRYSREAVRLVRTA